MVSATERVRQRLLRAASVLESAEVDYAVAGGNAVAAWVTTVDEAAVRSTQDVDILLRRSDLARARQALEAAGLCVDPRARDAVHIVFAGEKVRDHEALPNPDVTDSVAVGSFRILTLDALVQIKLTAFRLKDRVHLLDMIGVGLIDGDWLDRVSPALRERLEGLLADPDQ